MRNSKVAVELGPGRFRVGLVLVVLLAWPKAVSADWTMLGANPQRTSWVADEVRGAIGAVWYRPFEPFIHYKVQVIAADGKLFVSTSRGLYALKADNGDILWVHATEVPLGHSPTYFQGKLYVGSYDRTIHCVDAATGKTVTGWTPYVAMGGFETNPLVVSTANGVRVYAGSRDGYFYALDGATGKAIWRFQTGAAIRNSAAMDADGIIYFASEDLHAYALKDQGAAAQLNWTSDKLLGDTFSSFWPVVYRDWVIFSGGMGYFDYSNQLPWDDKDDINADLTASLGHESGDWAAGTVTMNATKILDYYKSKPYRRRVFMLNRSDGKEYTMPWSGGLSYVPFTFSGITQSGSKYPPVVGKDGVLYTDIDTVVTGWTPSGALCGWKVGTPYISRVMDWGKQQQAADEPMAFSLGGNIAYWVLCCDRESGAFDLSIPFDQTNRWWDYWGYDGRYSVFPSYEPRYVSDDYNGWGVFGADPGIYGRHGTTQNPWIPYQGKLFRQMGNAVVAVAPGGQAQTPLPEAAIVKVSDSNPVPLVDDLKDRLAKEVQKIIDAGHLKPGLFRSNIGDSTLAGNSPPGGTPTLDMDHGTHYFSNPAETILALIRTLPHLSTDLQNATKQYIQTEMTNYPIDSISHVGFQTGTFRQAAVVAPDQQDKFSLDKQTTVENNWPWSFPLMSFYAAWKVAGVWPDQAAPLYNKMKNKLTIPCALSDDNLIQSPQMMNAYLAGYLGYLGLEKLAGQSESSAVRNEYNRLLTLRINNFSVDAPTKDGETGGENYGKEVTFSRHFIYLVPEIADELLKSKLPQTQALLDRVNTIEPYWFVEGFDMTLFEGTHQNLYEVAIFAAYTLIQKATYRAYMKYLDAPAFPVGDLFYLTNLVQAIEGASNADQGHVNPEQPFPPVSGAPGQGDGGIGDGSNAQGTLGANRMVEGHCHCELRGRQALPAELWTVVILAGFWFLRRRRRNSNPRL